MKGTILGALLVLLVAAPAMAQDDGLPLPSSPRAPRAVVFDDLAGERVPAVAAYRNAKEVYALKGDPQRVIVVRNYREKADHVWRMGSVRIDWNPVLDALAPAPKPEDLQQQLEVTSFFDRYGIAVADEVDAIGTFHGHAAYLTSRRSANEVRDVLSGDEDPRAIRTRAYVKSGDALLLNLQVVASGLETMRRQGYDVRLGHFLLDEEGHVRLEEWCVPVKQPVQTISQWIGEEDQHVIEATKKEITEAKREPRKGLVDELR